MSTVDFPNLMVPDEDFVFYVRKLAGDQLIDFSGWAMNLVGRIDAYPSPKIFSYSESDAGIFEVGTFSVDREGELVDHNLKITIPGAKALELREVGEKKIRIGLIATPVSGSKLQLIPDAAIKIDQTIAP